MKTLQEDLNELNRLKNEILERLFRPMLDFCLEIKAVMLYRRVRRAWDKMMTKMQKRGMIP